MTPFKFALAAASLTLCGASFLHADTRRSEPVAGAGESIIAQEIEGTPVKPTPALVATSAPVTATAPQIPIVKTGEQAQPKEPFKKSSQLWKVSVAALIGANSLDVISSWGKHEANPLLKSSNGTFGMKGLGIKSTIVGASLAPQFMLRDHKELRKTFAVIDFAESAFFSGVAFHNFGLSAPKLRE